MGIENDSNCSFCRKERDTINHLFCRCALRTAILRTIPDDNDGCPNSTSLVLIETIPFGHDSNFKSYNTLDLIILRAFYYYLQMQNKQEHTTVVSVQTLLKNYISSRQIYSKTEYVS